MLVRSAINSEPSLSSISEMLRCTRISPKLPFIQVDGIMSVGVPIGLPDFVTAFCQGQIISHGR